MKLSTRNDILYILGDARMEERMLSGSRGHTERLEAISTMIREFRELSKDCVHEEPNEFNSFDSFCDVIPADEWMDARGMVFTPSDGDGYWANDVGYSREHTDVFGERPVWATKVAWYNQ